jgi:hypothetical protein
VLLALGALGGAAGGCSQDGGTATGGGGGASVHTLVADAMSVVPFQIVELHDAAASFAKDEYQGTLGSKTLKVARVSPTDLAIAVPAGLSGSVTLKVTVDGIDYTLALDVQAAPELPSAPADFVNAHVATLQAALDGLRPGADASLSAALDAADANLALVTDSVTTLDAASLNTMAQAIAANQVLFEGGISALKYDKSALDHLDKDIAKCGKIVAGGALLSLLIPGAGLFAALGAVAWCGSKLIDDTVAVLDGVVKPEGDVSVESSTPGASVKLVFTPGKAQLLGLQGDFGSLTSADLTSSDPLVSTAAQAVQLVTTMWPRVNSVLEPDMLTPPGLDSVTTKTEPVDGTLVSVDPASVTAGVKLTGVSTTKDSVQLTFDGKRGTEFQFDITYDDGTLAPKKTRLQAKLLEDPCGLVGTLWTMDYPEQPFCMETVAHTIQTIPGLYGFDELSAGGTITLETSTLTFNAETCVWTEVRQQPFCTPQHAFEATTDFKAGTCSQSFGEDSLNPGVCCPQLLIGTVTKQ